MIVVSKSGQSSTGQIGVPQASDILACMKGKRMGRDCKCYGEMKKKSSVSFILNLLSPDEGNISAYQHLLSHLSQVASVLNMWQWHTKHHCLTFPLFPSIISFICHIELFIIILPSSHAVAPLIQTVYSLPSFSPTNITRYEENSISIQKQ